MKKIVAFLFLIFCTFINAQKPQTIAYIDMEYILENLPNYKEAQTKLDNKVVSWRQSIDAAEKEIIQLKTDLSNEQILLTEDLIFDKKETIELKEIELQKMRARFFGEEGTLFELRQQLVQPIQDEIFNAIQLIIQKERYDFVIDRSSDLILLHANPKYDISRTVINYITKTKKELEIEEKKAQKEKVKDDLKRRLEIQEERKQAKEKNVIHR